MAAALALRRAVFRAGSASDEDRFDRSCRHVLVLDGDRLVACARVLSLPQGGIERSYSAQFYDLSRLAAFPGPLLELGRFCIHPDHNDPDILRLTWGALTRIVDAEWITLLFGCSSFAGADPAPHQAALAQLVRYVAPARWQPGALAAHRHDLPAAPKTALTTMPPLLRSYLQMGAWVSDHAVIDRELDTLHVFTGLEIARVPPARARALRALAASD